MRAFLLLVVITVLVMSSVVLTVTYFAPDQVAARHAEALARQAQAERLQPVDDLLAVGWRLLPLGFAAGLAGLSLLAFARRLALVRVAGGPPLPYAGVAAGQYAELSALGMAAHFEVERTRAANPAPALPPNLRSYSPKYVTAAPRVLSPAEPRPALAAPGDAAPVAIPTFGDLLRLGQVGRDRALLLGYTPAGVPVKGDMDSLFSFAVAGLQGAGKTTTERFLLGQVALQGGRFAVIDPHRDTGEQSLAGTLAPLRASFLLPPAAADSEIYQVIELVNEEIDRRERGEPGPPIILAVDEWTDLSRRRCAEDLQALARRVSTVGRKLGIYTALSGQGWTKESAGEVRDYLTAAYVHKLRPQVARLLAPGIGNEVWSLEPGQAILDRTTGPRLTVTIPNTTGQDLAAVARLLPARPPLTVLPGGSSRSSSRLDAENDGDGAENEAEVTTTTATTTAPARPLPLVAKARDMGIDLEAEDWRVLDLLDEGKSYHKIGEIIAGRSGGTAYSKWRGQAERLHDLITNWPDGERWSTAADGD